MEIIWSNKAKQTYFNVLNYLHNKWTKKEIKKFQNRVDLILDAIKKNPGIFPISSKRKNVRKAIVDKNNSFFYTVSIQTNKIYLLTFFDNRQNPEKLKSEGIL